MENRVIKDLEKALGVKKVEYSNETLIAYSYDGFIKECMPDVVVFPENTEDTRKIIEVADKHGVFFTSRGSGSNLCGASVPKKGGIVISFTKMNKTIEINKENRYAVVQPGKILDDLNSELEPYSLFYPVDLGSSRIATIGGSIALNSGGMRALKYGVTRDYILGLKAVLPNGELFETGVKTKKNVVGYDLISLLCGSEGTLAVITEATVKLIVKPKYTKVILLHYKTTRDACNAVNLIMAEGIIPSALEIADKLVINAVEDYVKVGLMRDAAAFLLVELSGEAELVELDSKKVEKICKAQDPLRFEVSQSAEESEKLWLARKSGFGSMARYKPICIAEDVTVPIAFLAETIELLHKLADKYGVLLGLLSHAGDGNLHPHFLLNNKEEETKADSIMDELIPFVTKVGGTISGEHGVGLGKKKFLGYQLDDKQLGLMRKIKEVFDPKKLLNPGSFLD